MGDCLLHCHQVFWPYTPVQPFVAGPQKADRPSSVSLIFWGSARYVLLVQSHMLQCSVVPDASVMV